VEIPDLGYRATLPTVLRRAAREFGDDIFLVTERDRVSYRDVEADSRALAEHLLAIGVGKGTRVGLFLPSSRDWVVGWAAAGRIGALVMPFSTHYRAPELRTALRIGDVDTLIVRSSLFGRDQGPFLDEVVPGLAGAETGPVYLAELPYLRRVVVLDEDGGTTGREERVSDELLEAIEAEVVPADELITIFTSGTTADPKGVVHTHGALMRKSASLAEVGGGATPGGRNFVGMPMFWVGGVQNVAGALQLRTKLVFQERFDAETALELIEREDVTAVAAWPNVINRLRRHPSATTRDLSRAGMLALPPDVNLVGLGHSQLGMTESLGPHSAGPRPGAPDEERAVPLPAHLVGSFGAPLASFEHRVVDPDTGLDVPPGVEGELWVRGWSMMVGLYKHERADSFEDDGWFRTGDKVSIRDGYVFFTGRLTEMIKPRGANVAPREVELALEALPNVHAAFVFGVPDGVDGEQVAAVLVPETGLALDPDDVRSRLRERIASYKVPTLVRVADSDQVPWLATGKPDKRRMLAWFARS
jgi:acyl-CoA synthetase (AMP-forming)/AMP-acid ligase II